MADTEVRITLRLPEKLRDRLQRASESNNRSMNGEIVDRLDWSFDRSTQEMQRLLDDLEELREKDRQNEIIINRLTATVQKAKAATAKADPATAAIEKHREEMRELREQLRRLDERIAKADRIFGKSK